MSRDDLYWRRITAAAIAYARRGWRVIELLPDGDKANQPRHKKPYEAAHCDPDTVDRVWRARASHIGLAMGYQRDHGVYHVGLDEDRPGILQRLADEQGQALPETWRQSTRRGQHHVFKLAEHDLLVVDLALKNKVKVVPHLDIRIQNGYLTGAPCQHADGVHEYRVVDDRDPVEMPRWLFLHLAERCFPPVKAYDAVPDVLIDAYPYAARLQRGHVIGRSHAPAIQGQSGSATAMGLVGKLVQGLVLRVDDVRSILNTYNDRCLPPWSRDEIEHMIDSATRLPRHPRGYLCDADSRRVAAAAVAGDPIEGMNLRGL